MRPSLTTLAIFLGASALAVAGGQAAGRFLGECAGPCDAAPRAIFGSRTALAQEKPASLLEQLDASVAEVAGRVRPSVAQVLVSRTVPLDVKPDGTRETAKDQVSTSGVVWSADGYVVSLGRAFESADAIDVVLGGAEPRRAELIGTDDETGLALLKVDPAKPGAALVATAQGSAQRLKVGSIILSFGNPFGLSGSVSLGNVSGLHRAVKRGQRGLADVIQITTPVNPGDPGGLLTDARGEAVGIVASTYERPIVDPDAVGKVYRDLMKLSETLFQRPPSEELKRLVRADEARFAGSDGPFGGQGIGFAIPIEEARAVVERLKAGPISERGYLGVQVVGLEAPAQGVAVVGVKEGSPAEKAGLRQHDIVVKFGGKVVPSIREFKRLVLEAPVGKPVEIEVRRGEATSVINAVLEKRGKPQ